MSNPFENIITLEEAVDSWEIKEGEILNKILDNVLVQGEDVKNINGTWLISIKAMEREFGSLEKDEDLVLSNMPYGGVMYESYIKNAFNCSRGKDPAGLADSLIFDMAREDEYFYLAKASTSYACVTYNKLLEEDFKDRLDMSTKAKLRNLAINITQSTNKDDLYKYMNSHKNLVLSIKEDQDI